MTATDLLFITCLISIFILFPCALLAVLFKHATKDRAYVRTGRGGEVIAKNTGIFILPILHHATPINLKSIDIALDLADKSAVLTKDCMKANLSLVFYVKVKPENECISIAAQTLGNLTVFPDKLKEFLSGQLIHATRNISAQMTLIEIQQQSSTFVNKVQQAIEHDLALNGLTVDRVTLKSFNQSAIEFYSEQSILDTEGLSELTKIIQVEKQTRQEIEQQSLLQTKNKDLEMEKLLIEVENKKKQLRLNQEKETEIFKAANKLTISQNAIKIKSEESQEKILAEQALETFKYESEIALAEKLREKLKQQIETDLIKAKAEKAEVQVKLARKLEKADTLVKIKLLKEKFKDQYETDKIIASATARKEAEHENAAALKIKTESESERLITIENSKFKAEQITESSLKNRFINEAEGLKILIDAVSTLPESKFPRDVYPELIDLLSHLCLENNQLLNQSGIITSHEKEIPNHSSRVKVNNVHTEENRTKLQAILDDARSTLAEEAISTINDSNIENVIN